MTVAPCVDGNVWCVAVRGHTQMSATIIAQNVDGGLIRDSQGNWYRLVMDGLVLEQAYEKMEAPAQPEFSLYFTPAFNGVNFQLAVSCAGNGTWVNAVVSEVSSPTSASADINRLDGNGIDGFSPNDILLSDEDDIPKGCVRSEELAGYMFQLESRKDGKPVDSYDMSALTDWIFKAFEAYEPHGRMEEPRVTEYLNSINQLQCDLMEFYPGRHQVVFDDEGNLLTPKPRKEEESEGSK